MAFFIFGEKVMKKIALVFVLVGAFFMIGAGQVFAGQRVVDAGGRSLVLPDTSSTWASAWPVRRQCWRTELSKPICSEPLIGVN